ncbi:MAG: hypothetical protein WC661_05340 [Opitutaceae bacterium]
MKLLQSKMITYLRCAALFSAVVLSLPAQNAGVGINTIKLNGEQVVTFSHTPDMVFKGTNGADGLKLEFQGAAPTVPNWMQATIPCTWPFPADGYLELDVRAGETMNRYFAITVLTGDGWKYSARLGTPQTGFKFGKEVAKAVVLLSDLKAEGGRQPKPGAPITGISLVMTTIPEGSPKTVLISEIRLVSE